MTHRMSLGKCNSRLQLKDRDRSQLGDKTCMKKVYHSLMSPLIVCGFAVLQAGIVTCYVIDGAS